MPNNTTQQPNAQAPQGDETDKHLVEFLKGLEQHVMELSARLDVLEAGQPPAM